MSTQQLVLPPFGPSYDVKSPEQIRKGTNCQPERARKKKKRKKKKRKRSGEAGKL